MAATTLIFVDSVSNFKEMHTSNFEILKGLIASNKDFCIRLDSAEGTEYMRGLYVGGDLYNIDVVRGEKLQNWGLRQIGEELMTEIELFLAFVKFNNQ